jgi:urea transport system permease protein
LRSGPLSYLAIIVAVAVSFCPSLVSAQQPDPDTELRSTIQQVVSGSTDEKIAAIGILTESRDPRILAVLENFKLGLFFTLQDELVLCPKFDTDKEGNRTGQLQDFLTAESLIGPNGEHRVVSKRDLEDVVVPRKARRDLADAIRVHELYGSDLDRRLSAVQRLGLSGNLAFMELLEEVAAAENPRRITYAANEGVWLLKLGDPDNSREDLIAAARQLGDMRSARGATRLVDVVELLDQQEADGQSVDEELRTVFQQQLTNIKTYQDRVGLMKDVFNGISTGSVLVLIALGLAIIFGQMGVINMAHGELVMLGAYSTYIMQLWFGHTPEVPNNWFFIAALPASFLIAAFIGLLIEWLVVRHLYDRPLESLLATWGVGLILIQFIRAGFPWSGADWAENLPDFLIWGGFGDNIGVNSPTWLVGAADVMTDLSLPYNRIFIIAFTLVAVLAIACLMRYTRLGLRIRATVQNRDTAASLGVHTRRVDRYTFAIGSGLAGIAGYALTLIAGVTPDMGQNYIVDSFLVVVTGGVGKLAGSVSAGMGVGVVNKFFEPITFGSALFWVGLAVLVSTWIILVRRAKRIDPTLVKKAVFLPPLFVYQNRKQRGLVRLLLVMAAGGVLMWTVSRAGFDHMLVIREDGGSVKAGQRLLIADQHGTRQVVGFGSESPPGSDPAASKPDSTVELGDISRQAMARRLTAAIKQLKLRGVRASVDGDRIFIRGSTMIVLTSDQDALGVSARRREGYRSKPGPVSARLPGGSEFLAQPVQTIWAKVLVLILVMLFIQWRPAGLFPPRGRLADD